MIVDLEDFPDLGLIIKASTGVRYTSQTAGFACEHPEAEGFLVPLRTKIGRPEIAALFGLFRGAWNSLNATQADQLDAALHRHGFSSVRVDRSLLAESKEAWVHVRVTNPGEDAVPLTLRSGEVALGILIWPNSD